MGQFETRPELAEAHHLGGSIGLDSAAEPVDLLSAVNI